MLTHAHYMTECLTLAARGAGAVAPNPRVGALIVHGERILGRGFHEAFGGPHAEVNAVRSVNDPTLLSQSTLYVSLEPCCHFGKTPPCTDLIIESKIPRVVIGITDIFAKVAGGGIQRLRDAGVEVTLNVCAEACFEMNRRFFTFHALKRPYVILKWAETSDRYLARLDGTSRWITGEEARTEVHRWRAEEASIMVGRRTAELDDPALTVRHVTGRHPLRVVLDRELTLPPNLQLFDRSTPTLIFNALRQGAEPNIEYIKVAPTLPLHAILTELHTRGVLSVIIEGGGKLLSSVVNADLWDEARVFRNPHLTFGAGVEAPRLALAPHHLSMIGSDELTIYRNHSFDAVKARCIHG